MKLKGILLSLPLLMVMAAGQTTPTAALPATLPGLINQTQFTADRYSEALVRNAPKAKIGCGQLGVFSYFSPAVATQSLNRWLAAQHLTTTTANEIIAGPDRPDVNTGDQMIPWKAENDQLHYIGMWVGNGNGGKLYICSGTYRASSASADTEAHQPTYHLRFSLFGLLAIAGFIVRRMSRGLSSSNLE